jgi:hypothetical protein
MSLVHSIHRSYDDDEETKGFCKDAHLPGLDLWITHAGPLVLPAWKDGDRPHGWTGVTTGSSRAVPGGRTVEQ